MSTVSSRVAIVTGGTSGIGKETAVLLASEGWRVVVSGRNENAGKQVVEDIKASGGEATFVKCDVSVEDSIRKLVDETVRIYGKLDGCVNNAGIATDVAPFVDLKAEEFEKMIRTNIMGVFWCMKYQLKQMLPQKSGSIVNLASMAGLNGVRASASYSATKHAVVGLTKSVAIDYATEGVRINAIAPGAIKTDLIQNAIDSGSYSEESLAAMFPMKRMGEPIDIAKGISFLLNNDYATGTILNVDGGLYAQ
ncbi:short chain dehydrogenase [Fusarium redolens]|uniref:Short chain dehydrogenase n=1 Tax=Fusarium redolens TaxID=48865 RepID=A0A9P9G567_FUSRE|nr:short chain dehydrogenase [Fusarium redolens]KAH7232250.1 short chain dehydrogenase [Fusarium redolens]